MIMVAIGVDRYLSICQPMLGALTSRRAWIVSSVLGLFAAMIGLCVALMYKCQLSFTNIRQRAADNILRRAVCTEIKLRFALMYSVRHYKLVALQSNCTSTTDMMDPVVRRAALLARWRWDDVAMSDMERCFCR